eukprot:g3726.t1
MNSSRSRIRTAGITSVYPLKESMCKSVPRPADHRAVKFVQEDSKWVKVPWKRSDSVAGVFGAFQTNGAGSSRNSTPRRMSIKGTFALRKSLQRAHGSRPTSSLSSSTHTTVSTKLDEIESLCDSVDQIIQEWNDIESGSSKQRKVISRARSVNGMRHKKTLKIGSAATFDDPDKVALSECGDWQIHTEILQDHIRNRVGAKRRRERLLEIGAKAGLDVKKLMSP